MCFRLFPNMAKNLLFFLVKFFGSSCENLLGRFKHLVKSVSGVSCGGTSVRKGFHVVPVVAGTEQIAADADNGAAVEHRVDAAF